MHLYFLFWFFFINGNLSLYFNISGLLIVFGETAGAALLSFKTEHITIIFIVLRTNYRRRIKKKTEIVQILIDLSIKSRIEGILPLQEEENETSILFLRRALGCLVDDYEGDQIRDILNTEIYFFFPLPHFSENEPTRNYCCRQLSWKAWLPLIPKQIPPSWRPSWNPFYPHQNVRRHWSLTKSSRNVSISLPEVFSNCSDTWHSQYAQLIHHISFLHWCI